MPYVTIGGTVYDLHPTGPRNWGPIGNEFAEAIADELAALAEAPSDITELDARLDTLEGQTLDARLDTLEGQTLDSRLDTLEGQDLDNRITALDGRVDDLEAGSSTGVINVVEAYGFVGDNSTLNDDAWEAMRSDWASGDIFFFPPGTYRFAKPHRLDHSQITITTAGHNSVRFSNPTGFGGAMLVNGPSTEDPLPVTDIGYGDALDVSQIQTSEDVAWINIREGTGDALEINGSANFCVELNAQFPNSIPLAEFLVGSQGRRSQSNGDEPLHTSFRLETAGTNGLRFYLKIGNDVIDGDCAASDCLTPGAYHHIEASYNGSVIRLFVDGVQVASKNHAGTISQKNYESVAVGYSPLEWPYPAALSATACAIVCDSVRFSASRHTANFTPPAHGKLTVDGSTRYLCNFDEVEDGFVVAYGAGGAKTYHQVLRPVQEGQEINLVSVSGITWSTSYAGGIHAYRCVSSEYHDMRFDSCKYGIMLRDNCYLSNLSDFYVVPAQPNPWWGIAQLHACGPSVNTNITVTGAPYGMIFAEASAVLTNAYLTGCVDGMGLLQTSGSSSSNLTCIEVGIADEDMATPMDANVGLFGAGICTFINCGFECTTYDVTNVKLSERTGPTIFQNCYFSGHGGDDGTSPIFTFVGYEPGNTYNSVKVRDCRILNGTNRPDCTELDGTTVVPGIVEFDTYTQHGEETIANTDTSFEVTFERPMPDDTYVVLVNAIDKTGAATAGSAIVDEIDRDADGSAFTVTVQAAPGAGTSRTYAWSVKPRSSAP